MKKIIFTALAAGLFVLSSCGGSQKVATGITKGSLSQFDTLSYAVGINFASMVSTQLADLPLDYDAVVESLTQSALGTNKVSHEEAGEAIQDYFMNKRQPRAIEVQAARDEADSIALANGADAEAVRAARQSLGADAAMFEDEAERQLLSKSLGNDLGNSLISANIPVQTVWIKEAFKDVVAKDTKLSEMEANAQIQKFFSVTLPAANLEASNEWLASIEKKSGVQKTESGILYKIEKAGDQEVMAIDSRDVVKVKYTGKNRKGKVFDSSRYADMDEARLEYLKSQTEDGELSEEGEVIEFPLNRVIPGWTEGMKLVGKGGRISLWIPASLAYGERGAGADIGANDALYFDVELVDVTPFETEEAAE